MDINQAFDRLGNSLANEKWKDAIAICDSLIDSGMSYPEIFQTKLLAEAKVKSFGDLKEADVLLEECDSYSKVMELSDEEVTDYIHKCNEIIKKRKNSLELKAGSMAFLRFDSDETIENSQQEETKKKKITIDDIIAQKKETDVAKATTTSNPSIVKNTKTEKTEHTASFILSDAKKKDTKNPIIIGAVIGAAILSILLIAVVVKKNNAEKTANQLLSNQRRIDNNDKELAEINARGDIYDEFASAYTKYQRGDLSDSLMEYYADAVVDAFDIDGGALYIYQKDYNGINMRAKAKRQDDLHRAIELANKNMDILGENMKLKGF